MNHNASKFSFTGFKHVVPNIPIFPYIKPSLIFHNLSEETEPELKIESMEMGKKLLVMVLAMLVLLEGSKALDLCNMSQDGLTACKPAVTQPNPPDPTSDCCKALSGADLTCLCSYKNSPILPSLGIDPGLAMGLPIKCNLKPPSGC